LRVNKHHPRRPRRNALNRIVATASSLIQRVVPGQAGYFTSLPGYRICTTPGITVGNRWNTSGS